MLVFPLSLTRHMGICGNGGVAPCFSLHYGICNSVNCCLQVIFLIVLVIVLVLLGITPNFNTVLMANSDSDDKISFYELSPGMSLLP
jgi:hypothetical protein